MLTVASIEGNEEFVFFDTVVGFGLLGKHDLIEVGGE